jgi:putative flippase GtrA
MEKSKIKYIIKSNFHYFIIYLIIGTVTFFVDMGSFLTFIYLFKVYRPISSSIAFLLGLVCHFTLNKYLNFKSFERLIHHQIRTYILVVFINLLVTVIVIEIICILFRLPPFFAKCVAVAVNMPIGFLGHRYLTFGGGARQFIKRHILKITTSAE